MCVHKPMHERMPTSLVTRHSKKISLVKLTTDELELGWDWSEITTIINQKNAGHIDLIKTKTTKPNQTKPTMLFRFLVLASFLTGVNSQEGCSVCGDGLAVGDADAIFSFPGQPAVPCGVLEQAGQNGQIPLTECGFLPGLVAPVCACGPVAAPTPVMMPPTPSPTPAPVPNPVPAPVPAPTPDSIDDGECVCYSGGDPVPIQGGRQLEQKPKGIRRGLREVHEEKARREALQVLQEGRKLFDDDDDDNCECHEVCDGDDVSKQKTKDILLLVLHTIQP